MSLLLLGIVVTLSTLSKRTIPSSPFPWLLLDKDDEEPLACFLALVWESGIVRDCAIAFWDLREDVDVDLDAEGSGSGDDDTWVGEGVTTWEASRKALLSPSTEDGLAFPLLLLLLLLVVAASTLPFTLRLFSKSGLDCGDRLLAALGFLGTGFG